MGAATPSNPSLSLLPLLEGNAAPNPICRYDSTTGVILFSRVSGTLLTQGKNDPRSTFFRLKTTPTVVFFCSLLFSHTIFPTLSPLPP